MCEIGYKQIIKKGLFNHAFQPIFSLESRTVIGYECLLRPHNQINPETLFDYAKSLNMLYLLDTASIRKGIEVFSKSVYSDDLLFLNIYPSSLLNSNFQNFIVEALHKNKFNSDQIVLEINEKEVVNHKQLTRIIDKLKCVGIKFAIDDLGSGHSTIGLAQLIQPNVIKLDRTYANNLESDTTKQREIQSIISTFANDTLVILEGIETSKELTIAKDLRIEGGQGYYLGKPASIPQVRLRKRMLS